MRNSFTTMFLISLLSYNLSAQNLNDSIQLTLNLNLQTNLDNDKVELINYEFSNYNEHEIRQYQTKIIDDFCSGEIQLSHWDTLFRLNKKNPSIDYLRQVKYFNSGHKNNADSICLEIGEYSRFKINQELFFHFDKAKFNCKPISFEIQNPFYTKDSILKAWVNSGAIIFNAKCSRRSLNELNDTNIHWASRFNIRAKDNHHEYEEIKNLLNSNPINELIRRIFNHEVMMIDPVSGKAFPLYEIKEMFNLKEPYNNCAFKNTYGKTYYRNMWNFLSNPSIKITEKITIFPKKHDMKIEICDIQIPVEIRPGETQVFRIKYND